METVTGTPPEVQVKVILRERDTEALVKVEPPVPVPAAVVRQALAENGVVFGIDDSALFQLGSTPSEEPVRVAHGTPPQPGADGKITYYFRTNIPDGGRPLETEEGGRVDHRELGLIENVTKGQVLAIKTPPTMGLPGKSVKGE